LRRAVDPRDAGTESEPRSRRSVRRSLARRDAGAVAELRLMPTTREALASTRPQTRLPRFVVALLRVPLFYKILGANAVIAALSGLAVGYAVHRELGTDAVTDTILLVALGTVVLSLVVNAIIVRFALRPIDRLEHAASMVHADNEWARAPLTALADPKHARQIPDFNEMFVRHDMQPQPHGDPAEAAARGEPACARSCRGRAAPHLPGAARRDCPDTRRPAGTAQTGTHDLGPREAGGAARGDLGGDLLRNRRGAADGARAPPARPQIGR